jgi:type I restriction enzyme M protein
MGKTNPLNDTDMADFIAFAKEKPETEHSWNLKVADIDETTFDLSVKNPNTPEEGPLRSPKVILTEMEMLDTETNTILKSIKELI